jgi:hypothetical protein
MKLKIFAFVFFVAIILLVSFSYFLGGKITTSQNDANRLLSLKNFPQHPSDAEYIVEGEDVVLTSGVGHLKNGKKVEIFGEVKNGKLNNDDMEDAAMFLKVGEEESELCFVDVALNSEDGFLGLNAIALDECETENMSLDIKDNIAIVSAEEKIKYFKVIGVTLVEMADIATTTAEHVFSGSLVQGENDILKFTDCKTGKVYEIRKDSHSFAALKALYGELSKDSNDIYVVLSGEKSKESAGVLHVNKIMSAPKDGKCEE